MIQRYDGNFMHNSTDNEAPRRLLSAMVPLSLVGDLPYHNLTIHFPCLININEKKECGKAMYGRTNAC